MARRLNLIGPAFEQPEYSLLAREKVCRHPTACSMLSSPTHCLFIASLLPFVYPSSLQGSLHFGVVGVMRCTAT